MDTKILTRVDTSTRWKSNNPILGYGEIGLESDTKKFKVGTNSHQWNDLEYFNYTGDVGGFAHKVINTDKEITAGGFPTDKSIVVTKYKTAITHLIHQNIPSPTMVKDGSLWLFVNDNIINTNIVKLKFADNRPSIDDKKEFDLKHNSMVWLICDHKSNSYHIVLDSENIIPLGSELVNSINNEIGNTDWQKAGGTGGSNDIETIKISTQRLDIDVFNYLQYANKIILCDYVGALNQLIKLPDTANLPKNIKFTFVDARDGGVTIEKTLTNTDKFFPSSHTYLNTKGESLTIGYFPDISKTWFVLDKLDKFDMSRIIDGGDDNGAGMIIKIHRVIDPSKLTNQGFADGQIMYDKTDKAIVIGDGNTLYPDLPRIGVGKTTVTGKDGYNNKNVTEIQFGANFTLSTHPSKPGTVIVNSDTNIPPQDSDTAYYGFDKTNAITDVIAKTLHSKQIGSAIGSRFTDTQQDADKPQYFYIIVTKAKAAAINLVKYAGSLGSTWSTRTDLTIDGVEYTALRSPNIMHDANVTFVPMSETTN